MGNTSNSSLSINQDMHNIHAVKDFFIVRCHFFSFFFLTNSRMISHSGMKLFSCFPSSKAAAPEYVCSYNALLPLSPPLSAPLMKIHSIWGVTRRRASDEMWQLVRETRRSNAPSLPLLPALTLSVYRPLIVITFDRSGTHMSGWEIGKQVKRDRGRGKKISKDTWGKRAWCWHRFGFDISKSTPWEQWIFSLLIHLKGALKLICHFLEITVLQLHVELIICPKKMVALYLHND